MECLAVSKLPEGPSWVYEIKIDGYRAGAVRTADGVAFFSRNGKSLAKKFRYVVEALSDLPPDAIVDGELVALDQSGRPEFNRLQNYSAASEQIQYFVFDVMKECVWVRPELVAQVEFSEWTDADRLRHSRFVGLREDKDQRHVVKEDS
jgi:ATP-dependent DNA ligase